MSMTATSLDIGPGHPAYAGHFPGAPVLPGVVLLDAALHAVEQAGYPIPRWQIASAKFQSAVRPGEALILEHEALPNGSVRFVIRTTERTVANGVFAPSKPLTGQVRGQQG
jgi:3-hydroxymyristoyl/3-hydroxydecanoyl-(acyl carrier protein) dehydratase